MEDAFMPLLYAAAAAVDEPPARRRVLLQRHRRAGERHVRVHDEPGRDRGQVRRQPALGLEALAKA
ncbi:MAG: hypothetical protein U1F25_10680 [Rubrivivax sp.]